MKKTRTGATGADTGGEPSEPARANMKTILLAVFGHYDSRGGTTGMPMEERTREELTRVMRKYDADVFGIEEPGDTITHTAYGMEARECDKQAHALIHGDTRPSEEDFMYVAELHYPEDADLSGDLEEPDGEGRYRRVMTEANPEGVGEEDEDGRGDRWNLSLWPDLKKITHTYQYEHMKEPVSYDTPDHDSLIEESLKRPFQLELGVTPKDFALRLTKEVKRLQDEAETLRQKIGTNYDTKTYYWNDPEYKAVDEQLRTKEERLRKKQRDEVIAGARVLKNPGTTRWDDDAFGFIIGTGL